jgi:hypothetical protein
LLSVDRLGGLLDIGECENGERGGIATDVEAPTTSPLKICDPHAVSSITVEPLQNGELLSIRDRPLDER